MDQKTFDGFFQPYAKNVDKADNVSAFWRLSDALIMEIITENIGKYCTAESVICDAGGGTGRWVVKMSKELPGKFMVYDRSVDMLEKAKENVEKAGLSGEVALVQGDLTDMKNVESESIDHIVSIYSPISFIYENGKAASEMYRVLKKGGKALLMGHSYYNALASKVNNYRASSEELERLSVEHRVKWAPHVPELVTFSKESMELLLETAGFRIEKTYGVPVFVQPGQEDFDPENEKVSAVSTYLENPDVFKGVFNLEMEHNSKDTVANRGMNIFTLATKI
jgi:ubiquinone/menaquinone biosynthesis C-methylase UbiE